MKSSWIFLRGLSRETAHWDEFPSEFEKQVGATVHCIDLPGAGSFFKQTSPSTITEIMEDLNMNSGHVTEQSWLLAHSMGCLVAIEWMKREPHRFHGAVLVNTSIKGISPLFGRLTPFALFNFFRLFLFRKNPYLREKLKYNLTCNHREKKESTIQKWMKIHQERPVTFRTMWNQIVAAATYDALKPRYPVLILSSTGDLMVSESCSQAIAKKWDLPIRTHEWAGHDLAHDDPQWVIDQIKSWLPKV
jgi:pimeloyl-ACP methyl ester carboxylesterase